MPGIYVRKAHEYDWVQQSDDPDLTVPGSYWLCHKDNIYKFIFTYHHTVGDIKEFRFAKELMKVIRKILKTQPRQGQQYGTCHLLVTYNETSWTRQDKMFALMKFEERTLATFSHAFVLTIEMSIPLENMEHDTNNTIRLTQDDENSNNAHACEHASEGKSNECLIYSSKKDTSARSDKCNHVREKMLGSENECIQRDNSLIVNNVRQVPASNDTIQQTTSNENVSEFTNYLNTSFKLPVTHNQRQENNVSVNNETKENNSLKQCTVNSGKDKINAHRLKDSQSSIVQNIGDAKVSNRTHNLNITTLHDTIAASNINTDTANLPYQYLIEKEIEDAKSNMPNVKVCSNINRGNKDTNNRNEQKLRKRELEVVIQELSTDAVKTQEPSTDIANTQEPSTDVAEIQERSIDVAKTQELCTDVADTQERPIDVAETQERPIDVVETQEPCTDVAKIQDAPHLKRGRFELDNAPARSADDITDLVMGGLMFTIRQGQNSVTVIEQKTNIEIDEVLENSEKVETKEGEKCLRNSSLLGLENLVTKIELQNPAKSNHTKLESSRDDTSLAGTSFVNNNENLNITNKKFGGNKGLENAEMEDNEDIIPEALQNKVRQSSTLEETDKSEMEVEVMTDNDLLMDDMDLEEAKKLESAGTKSNSACLNNTFLAESGRTRTKCTGNDTHKLQHQTIDTTQKSKSNDGNETKLNVPRIISDEIITVDQMPLALQRAIHNELRKYNFLNYDSVTDKQEDTTNTQAKHSFDYSAWINTQSDEDFEESIHNNNNNNTYNKNTAYNLNTSISENDFTLNTEDSQEQNVDIEEEEELPSPNEIQDITQNFCQHISNLQKKQNATDQKHLRPRKSISVSQDANDGETQVEMVKFFQDITRGAKVVVTRLNTKNTHGTIGKSSPLTRCIH